MSGNPAVHESRISADEMVAGDTESLSEQSDALLVMEQSAKRRSVEQEKQTIHGKVVDETGEPLIGVSILEKGTNNGTVTDIDGVFSLQLLRRDSSKLVARYIGYESQEITPSNELQIVTLEPSPLALNDIVVTGYGTQRKQTVTGSVASVRKSDSVQPAFGKKEFQIYCQQNADKSVCAGEGATVKVSFFIDERGKPSKIEYKSYSCEDAKDEIENLLSSSPVWTKTNRQVTMTIKW